MILTFTSGYLSKGTESRDSRRYLHTRVPSSVTHYSQVMEATQLALNRRRDKQNHGIFSLKKEGTSDTCYHMDEL